MFTGLIETIGQVKQATRRGSGMTLRIQARMSPFENAEGDSIAVNGLCLTATDVGTDSFSADVSSESIERSILGELRGGDPVNLERALRLGDRLGGHMVSGHIDGVGTIVAIEQKSEFQKITFSAPEPVMLYLVEKGSVAIDGISLTVNGVQGDKFWVMVIPETLKRTILAGKAQGRKVNIESDLLGKYVARLLGKADTTDITMKKLLEEGYL